MEDGNSYVNGTRIRLTPKECLALKCLARTPRELVSNAELYRHVYYVVSLPRRSSRLRVLITKLRKKLPVSVKIEAQWGRGYVITGIETPESAENSVLHPAADARAPFSAERGVKDSLVGTPRARDGLPKPTHVPTRPAPHHLVSGPRPPPPSHPRPLRTEELAVIDRFLVEKGVTRGATLSPGEIPPPLQWDKMKRKWVRVPPAPEKPG